METSAGSPAEAVMIDSLLSVDQYRGADKATVDADGKPARDIAEVAAATELILPKGSFKTTSSVSSIHTYTNSHTQNVKASFVLTELLFVRLAAQLLFYCTGHCESISRLVWTGW